MIPLTKYFCTNGYTANIGNTVTTTVAGARGLDLVRRLARAGGPTSADLDQARRVARRRVVMKDRLPGPELDRLGFTTIQRGRRVCYGALDAL